MATNLINCEAGMKHSPVAILSVISVVTLFLFLRQTGDSRKYPPGPRGTPFFGNEFQVPQTKQWLYFDQLRKKYGASQPSSWNWLLFFITALPLPGDIVYLSIMGQDTIVLGSAQAALDLLETRGQSRLFYLA